MVEPAHPERNKVMKDAIAIVFIFIYPDEEFLRFKPKA